MENFRIDFTPKEQKAMVKFQNKHARCGFKDAIGGKFQYIFCPTGVGIFIRIKCNVCNEWRDITDLDAW